MACDLIPYPFWPAQSGRKEIALLIRRNISLSFKWRHSSCSPSSQTEFMIQYLRNFPIWWIINLFQLCVLGLDWRKVQLPRCLHISVSLFFWSVPFGLSEPNCNHIISEKILLKTSTCVIKNLIRCYWNHLQWTTANPNIHVWWRCQSDVLYIKTFH